MVEYQAAADTFRDRHHHKIAQSLSPTPETNFGKCTGICSIFQLHRQSSRFFQWCFEVDISPAEVGSKDQFLSREINATGKAHANTFARQFGARFPKFTDSRNQLRQKLFRILWSGERVLSEKISIQISECKGGGNRSNVNANDTDALLVQVEKSGAATSRCVPVRAFSNPSFLD